MPILEFGGMIFQILAYDTFEPIKNLGINGYIEDNQTPKEDF